MTDRANAASREARSIIEAQRQTIEACAKVAEQMPDTLTETMSMPPSQFDIAAAIRALRPNAALADEAASQPREGVEAWKARARSAANSIDALLLYATAYPTDSHALGAYALLIQLRAELGLRGEPRTVATFSRNAVGRSVLPPLPALHDTAPTDQAQRGERYRHVKRGTVYEIVGEGTMQGADSWVIDDLPITIYRDVDGNYWVRPTAEFHDGRFAALAQSGGAS